MNFRKKWIVPYEHILHTMWYPPEVGLGTLQVSYNNYNVLCNPAPSIYRWYDSTHTTHTKIVPTTRWAPLPPCPLTDTNYKMNCLIFQAYSNYNSSMLIRGIMRRISSRSVRRITTTTSCPKSKKCIGTNVLVSKTWTGISKKERFNPQRAENAMKNLLLSLEPVYCDMVPQKKIFLVKAP